MTYIKRTLHIKSEVYDVYTLPLMLSSTVVVAGF
jgi:hypothetical protein